MRNERSKSPGGIMKEDKQIKILTVNNKELKKQIQKEKDMHEKTKEEK